jgi:chromosome segregation ATPase
VTLEQRLARLERDHAETKSELSSAQEKIADMQNVLNLMHGHLISAEEHRAQMSDFSEKLASILTQTTNDTAYNALMLYWLCHVLERVEHIVPRGTVDLMMNSVEESTNPNEINYNFYTLFDGLRKGS